MTSNDKALSMELKSFDFNSIHKSIEANSKIIDNLVNNLVSSYCSELDNYVTYIKKILDDTNTPIVDTELDDFVLTLPTLLYFVSESQEALGIREDVSKAYEKDKFNETISHTEGTVAVKTALAELETQNEYLAKVVYQRAYKKIKLRVEAAYELLQSVKKVLSRRMLALELSKTGGY